MCPLLFPAVLKFLNMLATFDRWQLHMYSLDLFFSLHTEQLVIPERANVFWAMNTNLDDDGHLQFILQPNTS